MWSLSQAAVCRRRGALLKGPSPVGLVTLDRNKAEDQVPFYGPLAEVEPRYAVSDEGPDRPSLRSSMYHPSSDHEGQHHTSLNLVPPSVFSSHPPRVVPSAKRPEVESFSSALIPSELAGAQPLSHYTDLVTRKSGAASLGRHEAGEPPELGGRVGQQVASGTYHQVGRRRALCEEVLQRARAAERARQQQEDAATQVFTSSELSHKVRVIESKSSSAA